MPLLRSPCRRPRMEEFSEKHQTSSSKLDSSKRGASIRALAFLGVSTPRWFNPGRCALVFGAIVAGGDRRATHRKHGFAADEELRRPDSGALPGTGWYREGHVGALP